MKPWTHKRITGYAWLGLAILLSALISLSLTTPVHAALPVMAAQQPIADLSGSFSCGADGSASGSLFESFSSNGACASKRVFGCAIERFENIIGTAMGKVYCGVRSMMLGPLRIAITLCIALLGVGFITGMVKATARQAIIFLFKIALIWGFASDTELAIQTGYKFFFSSAKQGVEIVLESLEGPYGGPVPNPFDAPDDMVEGVLSIFKGEPENNKPKNTNTEYKPPPPPDPSNPNPPPPPPPPPPGSVNTQCTFVADKEASEPWCMSFLPKLIMMSVLLFPPLCIIILIFIFTYLWLFARAAFGFLYAMAMIAFLFTLLPIFLGFALFKSTMDLFESWLRYLISSTLQMILVFAFLGMMMLVDFTTFFNSLNDVLRYQEYTIGIWPVKWDFNYCWVCEGFRLPNSYEILNKSADFTCSNSGKPSSIFDMKTNMAFLKYVTVKILAFWIMGWAMQQFLLKSGEMARNLAGQKFATPMGYSGGGSDSTSSSIGMPGEGMAKGAYEGFKRGGVKGAAVGATFGVASEGYEKEMKNAEENVAFRKHQLDKAGRELNSAKKAFSQARSGTQAYKDAERNLKAADRKQKQAFKQYQSARSGIKALKQERYKHTKGGLLNEMRDQAGGVDDLGKIYGDNTTKRDF